MSALSEAVLVEILIVLETSPELCRRFAEALGAFMAAESGEDLDSAAAAARLGYSRDVVVRMARAGRIPGAYKSGREWRFRSHDLRVLPVGNEKPAAAASRPAQRRTSSDEPSGAFAAMMAVANSTKAA